MSAETGSAAELKRLGRLASGCAIAGFGLLAVVAGVWMTTRLLAGHGSPPLDPGEMGIVMMLGNGGLILAGFGTASLVVTGLLGERISSRQVIAWCLAAAVPVTCAIWFDHFRILAILLTAIADGLDVTARQAHDFLVQRAPLFPLTPLAELVVRIAQIPTRPAVDGGTLRHVVIVAAVGAVLLTYSILRRQGRVDGASDGVRPPPVWILLLCVLLIAPAYADIFNNASLAGLSTRQASPVAASSSTSRTVSTAALNVRSGPGESEPVVGRVWKGQIVSVQEERGGWSRIGRDQWVSSAYLGPLLGGERAGGGQAE